MVHRTLILRYTNETNRQCIGGLDRQIPNIFNFRPNVVPAVRLLHMLFTGFKSGLVRTHGVAERTNYWICLSLLMWRSNFLFGRLAVLLVLARLLCAFLWMGLGFPVLSEAVRLLELFGLSCFSAASGYICLFRPPFQTHERHRND